MFCADEQNLLEEAVLKEIYAGWEYKIFAWNPFKTRVDSGRIWSTTLNYDRPTEKQEGSRDDNVRCKRHHKSTYYESVPSQSIKTPKLLQLTESQNEGLNITLWRIVKTGFDESSCQIIRKNGHTILYSFGKIPFLGIKKRGNKKGPTPSISHEEERTSIDLLPYALGSLSPW